MPSRTDKEKQLKDNLDKSIARSKNIYKQETGRAMPKERADYEEKELKKAVKEADKMLSKVWNDTPSNERDTSKRPMFGYFGGVNFDKEGHIIR